MMFAVSTAVAFLIGFFLLRLVWPKRMASSKLLFILALPAGWSLTSVMYFLWLAVSGGQNGWYPAFECFVLASIIAYTLKSHRPQLNIQASLGVLRPTISPAMAIVVFGSLVTAFLSFAIVTKLIAVNRWGYWDAWARDNVKAAFLFSGGPSWEWIFYSKHIPTHNYPLLMPCSVARSWTWIGHTDPLVPQCLSLAWAILSLLLLFSLVCWLRALLMAVIASLAYLTFLPLLFWSSAQYADIPLACYMVVAVSMMVAAERFPEERCRFALLGGFFSGSAAWCKNEGLAFLVVLMLWWGLYVFRKDIANRLRIGGSFLAGVGIFSSAVIFVKVWYAKAEVSSPSNVELPSFGVMNLIFDSSRHAVILQNVVENVKSSFATVPLIVLFLAYLIHVPWRDGFVIHWRSLATVLTLGAIYYLVFLTTTLDLQFHVATAMDRLMLQVWPVALFSLSVLGAKRDCYSKA